MAAIKIELEETEKVTSDHEAKLETEKETQAQDLDVKVGTTRQQGQVGLCESGQNDVPERCCGDRPATETAGSRTRISEPYNAVLGGLRINSACNDSKKEKKTSSRADRIRQCMQPFQDSLGEESKKKISAILNEVELLSDIEKLLLYLQLPTGAQPDVDPLKQKSPGNPLGKKADAEIAQTYTWIQSHLEEDPEVSLPKQEVYEEYRGFCEANNFEPLCAADFGKVMKHIFPKVKPRRLGTRGNSRYCYSGLRKKLEVEPPVLPELDVAVEEASSKKSAKEDEVESAACHLIIEWAEKLFTKNFATVKDLAGHLLSNMYVDNRSVAGFTILSSLGCNSTEKGNQAATILKQTSGSRHRETQIHLQRKLHEKELIKEQKKKLVEQRAQVSRINSPKTQGGRKSSTGKKTAERQANHISNGHENYPASNKVTSLLSTMINTPCNEGTPALSADTTKGVSVKVEEGWTKSASVEGFLKQDDKNATETDKSTVSTVVSSGKQLRDDKPDVVKRFPKVPIPRNSSNSNPKVLPPAVSSIIFVPSVSTPMKLTDLGGGKSSQSTHRYKRIQPKPIMARCMRSSPSDTTSAFTCHEKSDSNDLLQLERTDKSGTFHSDQAESVSTFQKESSDLCSQYQTVNLSASGSVEIVMSPAADSNSQFRFNSSLESDPPSGTNASESDELPSTNYLSQLENSMSESCELPKISQAAAEVPMTTSMSDMLDQAIKNDHDPSSVIVSSNSLVFTGGALNLHSTKRHSEEGDSDSVISKKPHLESLLKFDKGNNPPVGKVILPPFSKAGLHQRISLMVEPQKGSEISNEGEEMSIQQLETDALMEYLHGSNMEPTLDNADTDQQLIGDAMLGVSSGTTENSPLSEPQLTRSNSRTSQWSQLRMLLERNLPQSGARSLLPVKKEQMEIQLQLSPPSGAGQPDSSGEGVGLILDTQTSLQECSELRQVLLRDNRMACLQKTSDLLSASAQKAGQISETDLLPLPPLSTELPLSMLQKTSAVGDHTTELQHSKFGISNLDTLEAGALSMKAVHSLSGTPTLVSLDQQGQLPNELVKLNCYTQFPSVPSSPNTRRRAFNFTPISPRQTPIQECSTQSGLTCSSPSQLQMAVTGNPPPNMVSVAVGPSQPPSAASSPFVSPRSTPVPLSRSRHNSGQSAYSTPRHTPFQNFDSGVSSVSTSPFISPQSTPVPLSRLRHNSSHSQSRTVTFNTSQSIQTHGLLHGSRSRHSSGPGGPHQMTQLMSPRSAPLSPMVNESIVANSFTFPTLGDTPPLRSRHNSASSTTPLSPMSAPLSPNTNISTHALDTTVTSTGMLLTEDSVNQSIQSLKQGLDPELQPNKIASWLNSDVINISSLDQKLAPHVTLQSYLLTKNNNLLWSGRQRHFSSSVIHTKTSGMISDPLSQEVQSLLKNAPLGTLTSSSSAATRSRSVPLRQMLLNDMDQCSVSSSLLGENFSKSYPATPNTSSSFHFQSAATQSTSAEENMETLPNDYTDELDLRHMAPEDQDILGQSGTTEEWTTILNPAEDRSLSLRRNAADLLETPLDQEDLQMTYDDLKDCEPEFSQLTQELEDQTVEPEEQFV